MRGLTSELSRALEGTQRSDTRNIGLVFLGLAGDDRQRDRSKGTCRGLSEESRQSCEGSVDGAQSRRTGSGYGSEAGSPSHADAVVARKRGDRQEEGMSRGSIFLRDGLRAFPGRRTKVTKTGAEAKEARASTDGDK